MRGLYHAVLRDPEGNIKWEERGHNLTPDEGVEHMLDVVMVAATAQTAAWHMGIYTVDVAASDTSQAANVAAAVTEFTSYDSDTDRNLITWTTPVSGSRAIAGSAAQMTINSTATIVGAFIIDAITGNGLIFMSIIEFAAAPAVNSGDTLDITYTLTIGSSTIAGVAIP